METLPFIHIALTFICTTFLIGTLFCKNDVALSIFIGIDCMLISFIGFMTHSSLSLIYPNRRLLALICSFIWILPFLLDVLKNKDIRIKRTSIKATLLFAFVINIILMFSL